MARDTITGYEDVELGRLRSRQTALERSIFKQPPADYAAFSVQRGRWLELNEQIIAIEARLNASDAKEAQS